MSQLERSFETLTRTLDTAEIVQIRINSVLPYDALKELEAHYFRCYMDVLEEIKKREFIQVDFRQGSF